MAATLSVIALLSACHPSQPHPSPPPATPLNIPYGFSGSGLDGGGFVNVVAFDPAVPGLVLAGGDVSGILRSTDYGKTWASADRGLRSLAQMKVASLLFSASGEAYAAVGDEGEGGGLLVSTDAGLSWSLRSQSPQFSGGNNVGLPLPVPHPRSTGTLLALDPKGSLLYAATFQDGVMRSADDGRTWTTLGLAGSYLRGLAIDPDHPNQVYAAAFQEGIFGTSDASGSARFELLANSPTTPEELTVVGGTLFAAAGSAGIYSYSGGTWRTLAPAGATWEALTGYAACGQTVLYAGADGAGSQGLMRSLDGGATWATLVADGSRIHANEGGPGGPRWWLAGRSGFMLGGSIYTASQIAVEPSASGQACQHERVLVAGRSGVWGSADAGANWYPMVRGMAVTIVHDTKLSPVNAAYVVAATADWTLLGSNDGGESFSAAISGSGTGYCLAVDTGANPASFFAGTGFPERKSGGDVFQSQNPTGGDWTSVGLSRGKVLALAVQRIGGQPIALAAVDGAGVWRRSGAGPWQQVSTDASMPLNSSASASGGVSLAWPTGSTAYLYDRQSGLWRSGDSGQTWTQVWTQGSGPAFTGWVAGDPTRPGRVYVSIADRGLYVLDGPGVGSVESGQIHPVRVGTFQHPGPIAVDPQGRLFAAELGIGGAPDLRVSTDAGATWHSVADDTYRATAVFPLSITPGPGGLVYVSLNGNGLLIGRVKL